MLADENFEDEIVDALVALGHDVVTARAAGVSNTPDADVLAHAAASGRIVLTHDRDYHKLHKSGVAHAGIVFASCDNDFVALAGQLIRVVKPTLPQVP